MIYLDNAATTKPSTDAVNSANSFLYDEFFNPSSSYPQSVSVGSAVERARLSLIGHIADAERYNLIFTSGGSESDNIAVFSTAARGNFVTSKGEHSAVYNAFLELKNRQLDVRFADINSDGSVNMQSLLKLIDQDTSLVSVIHSGNETGVVNDINLISKTVKSINKNAFFHSDGVQAYGKIPFKLSQSIDMYTASSHKINGIKGTGILIYKKGVNIKPFIFGGGQEKGLRSGTENVFGIKVFENAAKIKYSRLSENYDKVLALNSLVRQSLDKDIFKILSPSQSFTPYILSVSAVGLKGQVLQNILADKGVICGTGSACSSKKPHSRILKQCGFSERELDGALRLSFDPLQTENEILNAVKIINDSARSLKAKIS